MLAFAKDITQDPPTHPDEDKNPQLKAYMEYHRKLNTEKLVYHCLDHAKTYLQKNMSEHANDKAKLDAYIQKAFPVFSPHANGADILLLMLRKLIEAHNSTNNWYRMNEFYLALVYDAIERFLRIYNRLLEEKPEKEADYSFSGGEKVDFDDWVQHYFHDLDFLIGKESAYLHYTFSKRNKKILGAIDKEMKNGKSRDQAVNEVKTEFEIDDSAVNIILGRSVGSKELELFYTSAENPIYEYLYDTESSEGLMDGESLIDHSYFLGNHLKGLNEEEVEKTMQEISKLYNN